MTPRSRKPLESHRRTLTDHLFVHADPLTRASLDTFRVSYELDHGPTDLTLNYTSQWPTTSQQWLFDHEPQRWYDGLPPFAKAFLKRKVELLAEEGKLERKPGDWIREFMGGKVRAPEDSQRMR